MIKETIQVNHSRFSRISTLLLASFVAVVALNIGMHATQSITTPNATKVSYNLNAGASSTAVNPAESVPVLVMGGAE